MGPKATGDYDAMIGLAIRKRRIEVGMSQTELAGSCGVTFQQVQKYEKGTNRVSVSRLHQIAQALKTSTQALTGSDQRGAVSAFDTILADNGAQTLLRTYAELPKSMRTAIVAHVEGLKAAIGTQKRRSV